MHPRNQFDNFTAHNSYYYFFVFSLSLLSLSYSIYIFIRSSIVVAVVAAACLCMPENNANACTLFTTIATTGATERESKPISNNKKSTIHDREEKSMREPELWSTIKRNEMNETFDTIIEETLDRSFTNRQSNIC